MPNAGPPAIAAGRWHGRQTIPRLEELGVALDPDDQSEFDWLTGQMAHIEA